MLFLSDKSEHLKQILDEQKIISNKNYRPFKYISKVDEDDGIILLNNLTDECVFLDKSEKAAYFLKENYSNETFLFLVKNWFLVPEDFNDLDFSKNIENTISLIYRTYRKRDIDTFTIFTTTDCNARCFYCYQHGCEYKTMSKQTALDVADYILKHKSENDLVLRWFGGEPLYNSEAIDIISDALLNCGVQFKSLMTTNGYLFDEEVVKKAKNKWNLYRVQITLDGTEEIYNKVKSYIYKDTISPYKKVTDNIELLLQNDIAVNVRLNMDEHNTEDLFKLTDEVLKRYKKYKKFSIYSHLLYDDSCKATRERNYEQKKQLQEKCDELLSYMKSCGKLKSAQQEELSFASQIFRCMADSDNAIMILPDGKLGKCEHYLDNHFVGSIYEENYDLEEIKWFKIITEICDDCDDCELRSRCRSLKQCHSTKKYCDDFERERLKKFHKERMRDFYHLKKEKQV